MDQVEIQRQRTNRILEISRELTSTVSLEDLLHKIVQAAAELTDSKVASILLFDEQTDTLRFIAAKTLSDQLANIPVPVDGSIAGIVFTSGEPQIVSDVRTEPRYYKKVEQQVGFEAHSLLAAPLQFKDRRIGVIELANSQDGRAFDQEDIETLTALAAQATVAIENARLVKTLQEAHSMAEALRHASAALSGTLSYDVVLRRILEQVSYVMPQAAANIMLIEGPEVVRVFRGHGYEQLGVAETPTPINFHVSDVATMGRMQQTGQPVVIPYVERDEEWVYSRPEHVGIKSYAGAPIRIQDQVIGFLNVNSATPGFFSPSDGEYLQAFANHAAIAIENARLYGQLQQELGERRRAELELRRHRNHLEELIEERTAELTNTIEERDQANDELTREIAERARAKEALQRRNQELAALNMVAQALSTSLELQDILDQALLHTVNTLGFTGGLIALANEQTDNIALATHTGLPQTFVEHLQASSASSGTLCDFLNREEKHLYIEDLCQDPPENAHTLLDVGMRSYATVPIVYQDRVMGALCLFDTTPHPISETDRALLTTIGQQIGVAAENARLFRDAVRERQVSHTLLDTAKALSSTLRLDKVLERALDELQRVVPYDAALISMVRDERCWTVASRGVGQAALRGFVLEERPLVQRVVRECGPVIVPDVQQEPNWSPVEGLGPVRSWLGVPLTAKDEVIGVLMMNSHQPFTYDKEAARPAFAFAHQIVLALENSRLYEQVQTKLREANLLHSVTTALSYTLDLDQILPYVARSLCEVLNVTSIKIFSLDQETDPSSPPATTTVIADYVAFDGTREERRLNLGQTYALTDIPAAVETLAQRHPIQARVDDPQLAPPLQAQLETHRVKAVLLLPMVIGDRVLGFAQVWESSSPRHFTEAEIAMGQTLIHQAAITIDNARLVEVLRQRTVELQSRNEELDAFAHTVAHDLKNPLNSLIGFAHFLRQKFTQMSEQEVLGDLQMIAHSGQKMNTIIDELLILASVRQMEKVKMEPLDMARIVADAQERLSEMIAEHQAEIVVSDDWPVVLGRGQWVEEVWVNYVSNALKYGGRPPRVELGATEQEDGTARFWVCDNGPGLTPEEQSQLFVPFTRLDQARAKGHGLGLSIVRRIVEKMGGQVGVESQVEQGTVFAFVLPMTCCE